MAVDDHVASWPFTAYPAKSTATQNVGDVHEMETRPSESPPADAVLDHVDPLRVEMEPSLPATAHDVALTHEIAVALGLWEAVPESHVPLDSLKTVPVSSTSAQKLVVGHEMPTGAFEASTALAALHVPEVSV